MNILILTGRFGMGHFSVAQTIATDIKHHFPNADITVQDFFEYSIPKHYSTLYNSYSLLVNKASLFYNLYYKATEKSEKETKVPFSTFFLKEFRELLHTSKPDVVISTLPFCSQLISTYKEQTGSKLPLITCITDISTHKEWINDHTDFYLVASNSVKQSLVEKGVDAQTVYVTGIPVKEQFKHMVSSPSNQQKHLLIMGGGLGMIPKDKAFYKELNSLPHVKTTVLVGNNTALYEKLHRQYENVEVVGYTNQVYRYMEQADLIVSKPGGITVFECIFSQLPILVFAPFLEQEMKNATFLEKWGIGKVIWNKPKSLIPEITSLLYNDSALAEIRSNMKLMKENLEDNTVEHILFDLQAKGVCV